MPSAQLGQSPALYKQKSPSWRVGIVPIRVFVLDRPIAAMYNQLARHVVEAEGSSSVDGRFLGRVTAISPIGSVAPHDPLVSVRKHPVYGPWHRRLRRLMVSHGGLLSFVFLALWHRRYLHLDRVENFGDDRGRRIASAGVRTRTAERRALSARRLTHRWTIRRPREAAAPWAMRAGSSHLRRTPGRKAAACCSATTNR